MSLEAEKTVVRRLVDEVQTGGNFAVFDELMDEHFVDHTPSPGFPGTRGGVRELYRVFRAAFPDLTAAIDFQTGEHDLVASRKTYTATHRGRFPRDTRHGP